MPSNVYSFSTGAPIDLPPAPPVDSVQDLIEYLQAHRNSIQKLLVVWQQGDEVFSDCSSMNDLELIGMKAYAQEVQQDEPDDTEEETSG